MRRRVVSIGDLSDLVEETPPVERNRSEERGTAGEQTGPRTEFEFELPRGYLHSDGTLHQHGKMRLATARDELRPQMDVRVKENPAYLSVVLLSQVVTELGTITDVHAGVVEQMYATDVAFLQDFYRRINSEGHTRAGVTCPACDTSFEIDLAGGGLGES